MKIQGGGARPPAADAYGNLINISGRIRLKMQILQINGYIFSASSSYQFWVRSLTKNNECALVGVCAVTV